MSEAFALRSAHGDAETLAFRPVWQAAHRPFRTARDGDVAPADDSDSDADAADYFREQLDDSYRKGFADGQAVMAEANGELIEASDRLAEAASGLKPQPGDALCETLMRTIRTLLERTAGFSEPDADTLKQHCASLAALAEKDCNNAVLHIHPQDRLLLGGDSFGLKIEEDASLTRGTLCVAHSDGWIEQGTQPVLDELEAMVASLRDAR